MQRTGPFPAAASSSRHRPRAGVGLSALSYSGINAFLRSHASCCPPKLLLGAKSQLEGVVAARLEEAVAARDHGAVMRFVKLHKPLGTPQARRHGRRNLGSGLRGQGTCLAASLLDLASPQHIVRAQSQHAFAYSAACRTLQTHIHSLC
jgi:hypothetical protein